MSRRQEMFIFLLLQLHGVVQPSIMYTILLDFICSLVSLCSRMPAFILFYFFSKIIKMFSQRIVETENGWARVRAQCDEKKIDLCRAKREGNVKNVDGKMFCIWKCYERRISRVFPPPFFSPSMAADDVHRENVLAHSHPSLTLSHTST